MCPAFDWQFHACDQPNLCTDSALVLVCCPGAIACSLSHPSGQIAEHADEATAPLSVCMCRTT